MNKLQEPSVFWQRLLRAMPYSISAKVYNRIANRNNRLVGFEDASMLGRRPVRVRLLRSDSMHKQIGYLGRYEPLLSSVILKHGKQGGKLLVDVGANIGYFSLLWLAANDRNTVVAFEAQKANFGILTHNIEFNGFQERAILHSEACGDKVGEMLFGNHWTEENSGCGGFVNEGELNTSTRVAVTTLDEVYAESDVKIDVLKIDTEGADTLVLKGAERMLQKRRIGLIFFEQNYWRMEKLQIHRNAAKEILERQGYVVSQLGQADPGLENFMAKPKSINYG